MGSRLGPGLGSVLGSRLGSGVRIRVGGRVGVNVGVRVSSRADGSCLSRPLHRVPRVGGDQLRKHLLAV